MKIRKYIGLAVSSVFLSSFLGCLPKKDDTAIESVEQQPIPVAVQPIQYREITRKIYAVGTLYGQDEMMIAPKVDGLISSIRADIGDRVWPGQTLLEIDPTDAKLSVLEMKKALEAELAKLGLREIPDQFILENVPGVRAMTVAVEETERRLKQKKSLVAGTAASQDELDLTIAENNLAIAKKNQALTEAEAGLAAAKMRKSQLEMAEQRLKDCVVKAPECDQFWLWSGITGPAFVPTKFAVAGRMVNEGELIRSNPVANSFKLVLDSMLKLKVQVSEQYASWIKKGQSCTITVDSFRDQPFPGFVSRINPTVDPQNRTFTVEIEVPNLAAKIKSGTFAKATILTKTDQNVATVPAESIVSFAGVTKIFIVSQGTNNANTSVVNQVNQTANQPGKTNDTYAKAIEVKTGVRDAGWVEVIAEIPKDAKLITSGLSQIVDDSKVIVK